MTRSTTAPARSLDTERHDSGAGPDIAGGAALLQIGDNLGVVDLIGSGEFTVEALAKTGDIPVEAAERYVGALSAAGIVERDDAAGTFRPADDFDVVLHRAGYVYWAMVANRPFIDHAREFLVDPDGARAKYSRDGRAVAVSSQWMGSLAFYPAARETIFNARPKRMADLGAGTCRLLIDVLEAFPDSTGVGLDLDGPSCDAAQQLAKDAGVADRLTVYERSIQSIADDPSPIEGADLVHGGFVFHDMLPDEEATADRVLANCRDAMPSGGIMAITDAVPFATNPVERRFASIVSYYHRQFMGRRLLAEDEWRDKLSSAGFSKVDCIELGFPSGRLYVGHR